ncbi:hypothetical protein D3C74_454730 [compost metagenome]
MDESYHSAIASVTLRERRRQNESEGNPPANGVNHYAAEYYGYTAAASYTSHFLCRTACLSVLRTRCTGYVYVDVDAGSCAAALSR